MIGTAWRGLRARHLDMTLRPGGELSVRIVERPGLWMDAPDRDALVASLRAVAARGLKGGALDYGILAGNPESLARTIVTLVSRQGRPIAFNALAVMEVATLPAPTEVLHLGLVMVDPEERSRSLSWLLYGLTCFLLLLRNRLRPLWVSSVTQVPAVVGMVAAQFSDVYPQPAPTRRSLDHLILARRVMEAHRSVFGVGPEAGFDEARFVITNAYTGGSDALKKSWDETTRHRDPAVNAFVADRLDYVRGDDLLQIGRMDLAAMRSYLAREVPRGALASLLLAGGIVALQRLILPVAHWADPTRPFGILRAR